MLTREELVELYRAHRHELVLSIYLDAEQHDPAERHAWRRVLDHAVAEARAGLEASAREQREGFDAALARLQSELDGFDAFIPDRGWVGFALPERVLYSASVPVPMPNLVRWEPGIRAAPYVRALKQERPVVTVLVDSRRARLFVYRDGKMEEPVDLRADTFFGDLTDLGTAKRATTHTGVRGATGTDTAQRLQDVETDRLLKVVVDDVAERAGRNGFVVIGGTAEAVAAAAHRLPKGLAPRVLERTSLHLDMTPAEVRAATQEAASELTRKLQQQRVEHVLDAARAQGRGCLGREETERALGERRVETLLLSRRFIAENPDYADHCVGAALEQDAEVDELSGDAAETLDAECGGIAAALRYRI